MLFKLGLFFVKTYISLIGLAILCVIVVLVLCGGLLIFPRRKQEYDLQKESDLQKEVAKQEKIARQMRIREIRKNLEVAHHKFDNYDKYPFMPILEAGGTLFFFSPVLLILGAIPANWDIYYLIPVPFAITFALLYAYYRKKRLEDKENTRTTIITLETELKELNKNHRASRTQRNKHTAELADE